MKNGNANRRLLNEGEIYSRSPCSEILGSPSRYTAVGRNGVRYDKNRSGYATDTELGAHIFALMLLCFFFHWMIICSVVRFTACYCQIGLIN